jgi:hypothetical protein
MDVGTELRNARQAAGLSLEQVSQNTRTEIAKLEALEANSFEQLPHGVYLESIVRAYAKEVGLDGHRLAAGLRAQLAPSGQSSVIGHQSPAQSAARPARHIDATATYDLDTFASETELETARDTRMSPLPVAAPTPASAASARAAARPDAVPHSGRAARVAMVALAFVAAVGLGWYLYETSRPFPDAQRAAVPAVSSDAVRTGAPENAGASAVPDRLPANDSADDTAGDASASGTPASQTPHEARVDDATPSPNGASPETPASAPAAADFSGIWRLDTEVLDSSVSNFEGLQLGYHLQLDQVGSQISGNGEKISENGRSLPSAARTAIAVRGTVDGNQLALTFIERGTRRSSQGALVLQRDDDGTLRGRFSSDAAKSSGLAQLRRPEG